MWLNFRVNVYIYVNEKLTFLIEFLAVYLF